jgi:mannan endo-1,4-beta-mannosidase
MRKKISFIILFLSMMAVVMPMNAKKTNFVKVVNGKFVRDGKPYYYVGTNFWYGAILASKGQGGDRQRLKRELDAMKKMGIDNLRILVGADGERGVKSKVEPTLQIAPGVYNDTILDGLDYLLKEMGKRKMVAVLYLNNSWEWSGGYGFYLEHAGEGKAPIPAVDGYRAYMDFAAKYATCSRAHTLFNNYVKFILSRTNRYTHRKYTDDDAIMSWQIGNEPRAFSDAGKPAFAAWLKESSKVIRDIDRNHLISVGSEGFHGCEDDMKLFETICADKNIDYCNVHLWPYNWGWAKADSLSENLARSCVNTKDYIDMHLVVCARINKPLVMEEFGFPRDGFKFSLDTKTTARDAYYKYVFSLVADNAATGGYFAGCNFWGWGGYAKPKHVNWQVGDDYCGDPAQEQQGLNSVFASDLSTLNVVKEQVDRMNKLCK